MTVFLQNLFSNIIIISELPSNQHLPNTAKALGNVDWTIFDGLVVRIPACQLVSRPAGSLNKSQVAGVRFPVREI